MIRPARHTLGWLLALALSLPAAASAQSDPKIEQAKKHMEAGAAFYNDPSGHKCEEAIPEFAKAYELSGSVKALRAQAICELELERDGDAIAHFETILATGGDKITEADRKQIESDLKALKAAVAQLIVTSNKPGATVVATRQPSAGYPITNRYLVPAEGLQVGIHPGQYSFKATVDGMPDITWEAQVPNASRLDKKLDFQPAPAAPDPVTGPAPGPGPAPDTSRPAGEGERPIPPTVWIFGGLTAALAVPTVIFMVSASSAKSDFDDQNGQADAATLEDLRDDVTTQNLVADVFLVATLASGAATAVFYFTRPEVEPTRAGWTIVPTAGPQGGGVVFTASF